MNAMFHFRHGSLCSMAALLLLIMPSANTATAAGREPTGNLVNPAQQVVYAQPLPVPLEGETLVPPRGEDAAFAEPAPSVKPGTGIALNGDCNCQCTSSIHQFYNSDCGCGAAKHCKSCVGGCGCCSRCEQWKRNCQAKYWGYPEYFCERPFGSCNYQVTCKMIANGLRDQMVLYEYDFGYGEDAWKLKERGLIQLQKLASRLQCVPSPLVIQASSDPQLDSQRQAHVLAALSELGLEMSADMVVIDRPGVRGMDGVEALPTYRNLLEQTRLRGNVGIESSALTDIGLGSSSTGSAQSAPQTQE